MINQKVMATKSLSNVGNLLNKFSDFLINLSMIFCHTKIKKIMIYIKAYKNHEHMIGVYGGEDNKERLTGKHETASWEKFSWGYANRGATVRVGRKTQLDKKGYMEVRAVSSNCDPYLVTAKIFQTTCL